MVRKIVVSLLIILAAASPLLAQSDDPLASFIENIEAGDYNRIYSLLISQDGELVTENYFNGKTADEPTSAYSVTKSVTSMGVGIAIEQGYIAGVDTPISELFPNVPLDESKQGITLENLLTMSAGFDWDEHSRAYDDPANDVNKMANQVSVFAYVLRRDIVTEPGTVFNYNSGISVLIGGAIQNTTGMPAEDYIAENLFTPLGITEWQWGSFRRNVTNTGWSLALRPLDMLKLGELYLNNGVYEGEQIVPAEWVELSTAAHMETGGDLEYGYQWWRLSESYLNRHDLNVSEVYFAWGSGGQYIIVIPELHVVAVATAGNMFTTDNGFMDELFQTIISTFA